MNFTAVIIEDEYPARNTLKSYLKKYFPKLIVLAELETIKESFLFLSENKVDIIFLDVQLKDGKGIELLNQIDSSNYKIIFTTAFDEYAIDAFKHKSFGYLLKPIDPIDFKEILNRVINDLLHSAINNNTKSIKIPIANGFKSVKIEDIIRCESESNYTKFILNNNEPILIISKTLKYVENELINSNRFMRVHQSHLINLNFIEKKEIKNNLIKLKNGENIPVSRANKIALFEKLS